MIAVVTCHLAAAIKTPRSTASFFEMMLISYVGISLGTRTSMSNFIPPTIFPKLKRQRKG